MTIKERIDYKGINYRARLRRKKMKCTEQYKHLKNGLEFCTSQIFWHKQIHKFCDIVTLTKFDVPENVPVWN